MKLSQLNIVALAELFLCWALWALAFIRSRRQAAGKKKAEREPASWLGILLVMLGYSCVWANVWPASFTKSPVELVTSMILALPSVALVWWATSHLGKQWRLEAALNADHELVRSGPYRWLRHPIYLSMLGMLLATGMAWAWWPMMIPGAALFILGTEIRVRAEEALLNRRFGEEFWEYKLTTRSYIPFLH